MRRSLRGNGELEHEIRRSGGNSFLSFEKNKKSPDLLIS
jgi:hypothetical protein